MRNQACFHGQEILAGGVDLTPVPLLVAEGTAYECGVVLGEAWRDILSQRRLAAGRKGWWERTTGTVSRLIDQFGPHLRDIMRGMQKGARLGRCAWDDGGSSVCNRPRARATANGCTSFSVRPDATLTHAPLSGQTKDTHRKSASKYVVLKLTPAGAPAFLTLTYPGELFGYGFCSSGMSLFRNSLYAGLPERGLPFHLWGLMALCAQDIEQVREMTLRYGVLVSGNALVSDSSGCAISVEGTVDGVGIVESRSAALVHANHVNTRGLKRHERYDHAQKSCSLHRQRRLQQLLLAEAGRLNAPLCMHCLSDHANYPLSICNHTNPPAHETTAAIVAEPTRGLLHVVRGSPCRNWPATYSL